MDDLISRQEAIDAIEFGITYARAINKETGEVKELFQEGNDELKKAVKRVKELPSAHPKIGKWYHGEAYPHHLYCSVCFRTALPNDEYVEKWNLHMNYCPNCGAKMEG